jgi:hypothetical protein
VTGADVSFDDLTTAPLTCQLFVVLQSKSYHFQVVNLLWTVISHHKGGATLLLESDCSCSVEVCYGR